MSPPASGPWSFRPCVHAVGRTAPRLRPPCLCFSVHCPIGKRREQWAIWVLATGASTAARPAMARLVSPGHFLYGTVFVQSEHGHDLLRAYRAQYGPRRLLGQAACSTRMMGGHDPWWAASEGWPRSLWATAPRQRLSSSHHRETKKNRCAYYYFRLSSTLGVREPSSAGRSTRPGWLLECFQLPPHDRRTSGYSPTRGAAWLSSTKEREM